MMVLLTAGSAPYTEIAIDDITYRQKGIYLKLIPRYHMIYQGIRLI